MTVEELKQHLIAHRCQIANGYTVYGVAKTPGDARPVYELTPTRLTYADRVVKQICQKLNVKSPNFNTKTTGDSPDA